MPAEGPQLFIVVDLIDRAEDHHDHHETELVGGVTAIMIIRQSVHTERDAEDLEHILLSGWRHS